MLYLETCAENEGLIMCRNSEARVLTVGVCVCVCGVWCVCVACSVCVWRVVCVCVHPTRVVPHCCCFRNLRDAFQGVGYS